MTADAIIRLVFQGQNDAQNALRQVTQQVSAVGSAVKKSGEMMRNAGAVMSAAVTAPMLLLGNKMVSAASDLNETISKTQAIFTTSSGEMIQWSKSTAKAMGLSQRAALDYAANFAGALQNIGGMTDAQAGKVSRVLVGLTADLSSFFNANQEDVAGALRSALTGEYEPMKRFNVLINDAALKQRALALGLDKGKKELSAQAKQAAALSLILEQTNKAQGDFAKTSEGLANKQRTVAAALEDLGAAIGQQLLPVKLSLMRMVEDLTKWFTQLSPAMKDLALSAAIGAAALGPLLLGAGGLVLTFTTLTPLLAGLTPLLAGLSAAVLPLVATSAAVAAAGVLIYQNWDAIRTAATALIQNVVGSFERWKQENAAQLDAIATKWTELKSAALAVWESYQAALSPIFAALSDGFNRVVGPLGGSEALLHNLGTAGLQAGNALMTGAVEAFRWLADHLPGIGQTVASAVNAMFGAIETMSTRAKPLLDVIATGAEKISSVFTLASRAGAAAASAAPTKMEPVAAEAPGFLDRMRTSVGATIQKVVDDAWNGFSAVFAEGGPMSQLLAAINERFAAVGRLATESFGLIAEAASLVFNQLRDVAEQLRDVVEPELARITAAMAAFYSSHVQPAFDKAKVVVQDFIATAVENLLKRWEYLISTVGSTSLKFISSITEMTSKGTSQIDTLATKVGHLREELTKLNDTGKQLENDAVRHSWLKDTCELGEGYLHQLLTGGFQPVTAAVQEFNRNGAEMEDVKALLGKRSNAVVDEETLETSAKRKKPKRDKKQRPPRNPMAELSEQLGESMTTLQQGANMAYAAYSGIAGSIEGIISGTMTWGQALYQVGTTFYQSIIKSIADATAAWITQNVIIMGLMKARAALGALLESKSLATSMANATATLAAWAPAAMVRAIGSSGAAAVVGVAAVLGALALANSFYTGGYTGSGDRRKVAGVVEHEEFVVNAASTARNRQYLEYANNGGDLSTLFSSAGRTGYASSGGTTPLLAANRRERAPTVILVDSRAAAERVAASITGPVTIQMVREEISRFRG